MPDRAPWNAFTGDVPPDLVNALYEAAVRPDALARLAGLAMSVADAGNAVLYLVEEGRGGISGLPADVMDLYLTRYRWIDPWFARAMELGVGLELQRASEMLPAQEFLNSRFYSEFARPHDTLEALGGGIVLSPNLLGGVVVHRGRHNAAFDDAALHRLRATVAHLQGALRLHVKIGTALPEGIGLAVLETLRFAAIVCDRDSRICYANACAEAVSGAAGLSLSGEGQRLAATLPAETQRLARAIFRAATGEAGGVMVTAANGRGWPALVSPLPLSLGDERGLVLVTLPADAPGSGLTAELLRGLYGLTPAEAGLALALLDGQSLLAIAARRGVAESTTRTLLGRAMRKIGADSQRDLVRILAALPAPRRH